ncbi:MAG: peroxiredoxin family protein [Nannocystales bacterium]
MKKLLAMVVLAGLGLSGAAWWLTRTEDIPEVLDEVEASPAVIEIPGMNGQPPLKLDALQGKTVVIAVSGTWSAKSPEGEATNRALSRWVYPESTVGYAVADAGGLGVFAERIEATMASYATEIRFPLYVDFEGVFIETFKLPKGHHGLVVLGPDGSILQRHSGGLEGEALEALREQLGASEPELGPPMPELSAGALDTAACQQTVCAFLYSGPDPVVRADIPRMKPGGFQGDDDVRLQQMRKPPVRLITLARKMKLTSTRGAFIGNIADDISSEGWERVNLSDGADALAALGFGDEPGLIVFDHGKEAVRVSGLVPLHQWGRVADLLDIQGFNDRRPPRE